jgi:ribose transport system permease protein
MTELLPRTEKGTEKALWWRPAKSYATALVFGVATVGLIALGATNTGFVSLSNFQNIIQAASITGIAAIGVSFITISGNAVSVSTGPIAVVTSYIFAENATNGANPWLVAGLAIAGGLAIGLAQGIIVAIGCNPIITTLAAAGLLTGVIDWATNGATITIHEAAASTLGSSRFAGVSSQTVVFVGLAVVATVVLVKHRWGRAAVLMGANRRTAEASGVRFGRMTVAVFGIAGATAALAAVLQTSQFGQAATTNFSGLTFAAVAAVFVGGVQVTGGRGAPVGAALGAVFIALLTSVMQFFNYSLGIQSLFIGILIAVVLGLQALLKRSE